MAGELALRMSPFDAERRVRLNEPVLSRRSAIG
jgi:hypothetical protein